MSGLSLIMLGVLAVIVLAVIFFGLIAKKEQTDSGFGHWLPQDGISEEDEILKMIAQDRFYQVFQPFVDAKTERIVGCEALTRLHGGQEKEGAMPSAFMENVKNEEICDRFDMHVLKKCCTWMHKKDVTVTVSCNFLRRTLSKADAADRIVRTAEEAGVLPQQIAIEVTEDAVRDGHAAMAEHIAALKEAGFLIYLDDFGKAYTSLEDLTRFRPDVIKLDKNLLQSTDREQGLALFSQTVKLAKGMGAAVLCEGVENQKQAEIAKAAGCDMLQGFYYYFPMEAEKMEDLLRDLQ